MTSKYGTSVIRRFANRVAEVQYRTLEPTAERREATACSKRFAAKRKRFNTN